MERLLDQTLAGARVLYTNEVQAQGIAREQQQPKQALDTYFQRLFPAPKAPKASPPSSAKDPFPLPSYETLLPHIQQCLERLRGECSW